MRTRHNITIEQEIWEEVEEAYGSGNISQKIEQLLTQNLGKKIDDYDEPENMLDAAQLTEKQGKLVKNLINNGRSSIGFDNLRQFCGSRNIYTRTDHIKNAVKALSNSDYIPYQYDDGSLKQIGLQCSKCDTVVYPTQLGKAEGNCPSCNQTIIDLSADDAAAAMVVDN